MKRKKKEERRGKGRERGEGEERAKNVCVDTAATHSRQGRIMSSKRTATKT